ncbi:MAG: redoxin domain-containing protein [bacterium]
MRSLLKLLASWALAFSLGAVNLQAQSEMAPLATPRVQLSDAERKFDDTVRAFEQHLYDAGVFSVDVTSHWTYSGDGRQTEGTNLYHVAVQEGGKYRIEAGSAEQGETQYICASDSQKVIRFHKPANYYSQKPASVTHDDLQHDSLTLQTLSGSGVELLIRPQMRAQLIARISDIRLVGKEMLNGREVTHMKLTLVDKRLMDVWFTTDKIPMLVQLATTEQIPINERKVVELVTTSKFKWNVGEPLPATTFTVDIPPDARSVDNLLAALRDGGIRQLLGKQAPLLELNDTNGGTSRLATYRGERVIVLIFWASWCAPSTHGMESLNEFVTEAEQKGAVVWAINLGETVEQVNQCVKQYKYTGSVLLDPETKALDKYLFGQLPMTVLIGKDGTVQAFHSGSTAEARRRIRQDTATLLKGEELVPVSQP